uniref:Dual specificity phosphatase 1 n=1 Tax=Zonotrichia albicollis TaxID=44394 RepID=A0A8D2MZW1_ZONAL
MNLCLCKICPNIYKRKCWVVKLNSEKMLHTLKKCIEQGFQMFPHAFLSSVSSVGARSFVPLFRQNSHWKGSEIQAGVCSRGAVILDWFHLILAMGDWLKSLNNQWGRVRALCNGPVPGPGLCHLSPGWHTLAWLSGTAKLSAALKSPKNIGQAALGDPWSLEEPGQTKPHSAVPSPMKSFSQEALDALMSSCPHGGPVEILPFLYLGSAYHASRKDMLDALGITALINVSANCPNHFEGHYQYKSIPVEDNHKADISSWFNEAIDFIDSVKSEGGRVFVHCQAGISRSATICLAYLMRTNRVKLDEAFEFVKQRRSIISPNFSFMGQLLQFESQVLAPNCSAEAGSPAMSVLDRGASTTTVFNFPVSIPVHTTSSALNYLQSPITTSPSC